MDQVLEEIRVWHRSTYHIDRNINNVIKTSWEMVFILTICSLLYCHQDATILGETSSPDVHGTPYPLPPAVLPPTDTSVTFILSTQKSVGQRKRQSTDRHMKVVERALCHHIIT